VAGADQQSLRQIDCREIDINKAKPSSQIRPGKLAPYESNQTTHFSVVDKDGNAVAVTYTLNTTFGTGIVAATPAFC
jgi:gamma-glutamyltranspeptidase/glutathione hydrolase